MRLELDHNTMAPAEGEIRSPRLIIEVATTQVIRRALKDHLRTEFRRTWFPYAHDPEPDSRHPLTQGSTVTSAQNPAVIYDDGAAFCSPIITFDADGNALHFHDALITRRHLPDYGPYSKQYFDALPNFVGQDGVTTCIAGLNAHITESFREIGVVNPIDTVIDFVQDQTKLSFPSANFLSFVSKQYENQQRRSSIVPDNTEVLGMAYIPPYLSVDGNTYLMPVFAAEAIEIDRVFDIHPGARITTTF